MQHPDQHPNYKNINLIQPTERPRQSQERIPIRETPHRTPKATTLAKNILEEPLLELARGSRPLFQYSPLALGEVEAVDSATLDEDDGIAWLRYDGLAVEVQFDLALFATHVLVVVFVPVIRDAERWGVARFAFAGGEGVVSLDVVLWRGLVAMESDVLSL